MQLAQATKDESAVLTKETIILRKYTAKVKNLTWAIVGLTIVLVTIAIRDEIEKYTERKPDFLLRGEGTIRPTTPSTSEVSATAENISNLVQ